MTFYKTYRLVQRYAEGALEHRVEWSGRFTPKGVSEAEASSLFQAIYDDGLKALISGWTTRAAE